MPLSREQDRLARWGPCFALRLLVDPEWRTVPREQMPGISDAAIFHRRMDLFWTLRDSEALALLTPGELELLDEFNAVFDSLHWRPLEAYPHISEVAPAELAKLQLAASRLLAALEMHLAQPSSGPSETLR